LKSDHPTRYSKSDSFSTLHRLTPVAPGILHRIRKLRAASGNTGDYKQQVVVRACDDLVGHAESPVETRFRLLDHVTDEISHISDENLPRYLFYRYRYDVFPRTYQVDDFPPCLQIEPASVCNYRCVFCFQTDRDLTSPKNGHMGTMSLDLFKQVVDQAEGNCEAVTLASRGEPLICKDMERMLAYLGGKFLALKINTNAWFLDEQKAHAILQSGANTLVYSADAAEEPLYSQMRVNGSLDRVVKNIKQFNAIRSRHYSGSKLITRVSGVQYSEKQDIESMEGLWGGLVDQVAFVAYNPWENSYQRPVNDITTSCSDLYRRMFVWCDGRVNPCDVDYLSTLSMGNVKDQSLSDLWTGEAYSRLRIAHAENRRCEVSPCNRCTVV
jgi:radical SAM protein with 4Fe4S-binding SPASM domain